MALVRLIARRAAAAVLMTTTFAIATLSAVAADERPLIEPNGGTPKKTGLPEFKEIEKAVAKQLAAAKDYKTGDLLTDASVSPVFKSLEELGWPVKEKKEIERLFLAENDWLVKQFRSKKGQAFMRNVAKNPDGFDRLDRLRRMPGGERQVADLIQSPDGFKMIEYMSTTQGGKNLGKQLSKGKRGENFNEPTGRLYTERQLIDRLKSLHKQAELETREKS